MINMVYGNVDRGQTPSRQAFINKEKAEDPVFKHLRWDVDAVKWCDSGWFLTRRDETSSSQVFKQPVGKSLPHFLGRIYSQEAASMLPAEVLKALLSDVLMSSSTLAETFLVLDLCAAPGGKSIQIGEALEGLERRSRSTFPMLIANDPNPERALRLRANLLRCGVRSAMVSELPGEEFAQLPGTFDAVLLDAPCSAEANVRRDPNALERWRGQGSGAYTRLLRRQARLLKSAWAALKPGGYMVYSTCTFNYFENEGQCETFAASHPDVRVVDLSFRDWGCAPSHKYLRLWPYSFDTEGFFVAAFQKHGAPSVSRKVSQSTAGSDFRTGASFLKTFRIPFLKHGVP